MTSINSLAITGQCGARSRARPLAGGREVVADLDVANTAGSGSTNRMV
jgi:hypothetical protein